MSRRRATLSILLFALTLGPAAWVALTNPLSWPLLQRGVDGVAARIETQMTRAISNGALETRLARAVAEGDGLRIDTLLHVAERRDHPVPEPLRSQAEGLSGRDAAPWQTARTCAMCAYDIATCRSLSQIAACALPVELTPLGDLNALRRQTANAMQGAPVDRVDAGLALVGLTATGAALATGGSAVPVKIGATAGRLARRMGALTPGFTRVLDDATDLPIAWNRLDDYALGRAGIEQVTDTAKLARLSGYVRDIGRVRDQTSHAETLVLLRHVETGADLSRLVRVSEAVGDGTSDAFALLGKSRVFRALDEIGNALRWAAALIAALCAQVLGFLALRMVRSAMRRIGPA